MSDKPGNTKPKEPVYIPLSIVETDRVAPPPQTPQPNQDNK